jgi:hypothetical protein
MLFAALFGGVILLATGLYFFVQRMEKDEQQEKQYLPDDDLIYDPVTGKKYTLEEAEAGIEFLPEDFSRLKTDEEIESFYRGADKERAYIERSLLKYGARAVEHEQVLFWLEQSAVVQQLSSFAIQFMYEIAPGRYLGIAHVAYRLPGHYSVAGSEDQLIGFVGGAPTDELRFTVVNDLEVETLPSGIFLRLPRIVNQADAATFLELMRE